MEPDHGGSIGLLRQRYPDMQIVGNKKTFDMLSGFHGIRRASTRSRVVTRCVSVAMSSPS